MKYDLLHPEYWTIHNLYSSNRKKVTRIDKKEQEITKKSYRLHVIDGTRFMASSWSNLVNNLAEGIHKIKCKYKRDNKKCETCRIHIHKNFGIHKL